MRMDSSRRNLGSSILIFALVLGACGGGDNAKPANPVITATPTPTPSPTPTSAPTASDYQKFGTLGQVSNIQFASLGYGFRYKSILDGWDIEVEPGSTSPDRTASIRFVAPDRLLLTISGQSEVSLIANGGGGYDPNGTVTAASYKAGSADVYLQAPYLVENRYLKYTLRGGWSIDDQPGQSYPSSAVGFSYGVPTSLVMVPASGTVAYDLTVPGSVEVDFTAGTVSGKLGRQFNEEELVYQLDGTTFTPNRSGFSGEVIDLVSGSRGQIEGSWTGPSAEEFMARLVFQVDGQFLILLIQGGVSLT